MGIVGRSITFEGWVTPPDFVSDGCSWAPDRWLTLRGWVDLKDACILHDFLRHYALVHIKEADARFKRHLKQLGAPRYMASMYWVGVKIARRFKYTKPYFTKTYELPLRWEEYRHKKGRNSE